jgi:hypothetical protein
MKCEDAPEEPVQVSSQKALNIDCNISATTNFMHTGISDVGQMSLLPLRFTDHSREHSRSTRQSRRTLRRWAGTQTTVLACDYLVSH